MTTPYHSQYWAHALTLRGSGGDIAALSRSIANARVDLKPWRYLLIPHDQIQDQMTLAGLAARHEVRASS